MACESRMYFEINSFDWFILAFLKNKVIGTLYKIYLIKQ